MPDDVEFDPDKDARNRLKHGRSLAGMPAFDDAPAIRVDDRFDYGEVRLQAFGRIDGIGHVAVFTVRSGRLRMISLRRARDKELKRYGR